MADGGHKLSRRLMLVPKWTVISAIFSHVALLFSYVLHYCLYSKNYTIFIVRNDMVSHSSLYNQCFWLRGSIVTLSF